MLAAFRKDMRVFLRDRWALVFALVMPVLVITVIAEGLLGRQGPRLLVPVVDEDGGPVARTFTKLLGEHADVRVVSRAEAERLVAHANLAAAAIVLPPHLSKQYLQGRSSEILLLTDPAAAPELHATETLLLLVDKEAAALADPFAEERITVREQNLTGNRLSVTDFEQRVPGFALMFVLLTVIFGTAGTMHDEHDWGTLARLVVVPGGIARILFGKLAARFAVGIVQMVALLAWGHWMFRVSLGSSPGAFLVLVAATAFAVVAAGMLVASLTRTREQTLLLGLALVMVLSGLGGCWWPLWMQPDWMRAISPAVFTTWAMRGLNDLILRQRGLDAMALPVTVLVAHGAATLTLAVFLVRGRFGLWGSPGADD